MVIFNTVAEHLYTSVPDWSHLFWRYYPQHTFSHVFMWICKAKVGIVTSTSCCYSIWRTGDTGCVCVCVCVCVCIKQQKIQAASSKKAIKREACHSGISGKIGLNGCDCKVSIILGHVSPACCIYKKSMFCHIRILLVIEQHHF